MHLAGLFSCFWLQTAGRDHNPGDDPGASGRIPMLKTANLIGRTLVIMPGTPKDGTGIEWK